MKTFLMFSGGLAATLACSAAMAQDECSTALALEPGVPVTVDTTAATGSTEPVSDAQCAGTFLSWGEPADNPDVWLVWTADSAGLATFTTCDPAGFDTSMVLYSGSCGDLTQVACNGDSSGGVDCQQYYSEIPDFSVNPGTTYYVRIGGYLGDSGVNQVSMTFVPFSGACDNAAGSCGEAHGTPGCSDGACCQAVCDFEAYCCDVEWDEFCVESAVKICGIFQYNCPDDPAAPANNCPTTATVVESGEVLAFSTINATQVAPDGCEGYDPPLGPDVWYQFTAPANGTFVASTCDDADYDNKSRGYDIGDGTFDPSTLPDLVVACNDDGAGCSGFTSVLTMTVEANTTYLVAIGGYQGLTGSGNVTFTFTPDAAACGDPGAGSCCEPQNGPFCAEGDCCETVCAIDPACCDTQWDGACASLALVNCAPLCGEVIPPYECTDNGANPYASSGFNGTGGVACAAGGITTPNTYAVVFTQGDIGAAYSFSCVNFGLDNSGGYLGGSIAVWIDEDGGDPSVAGMTLVQEFPVGLYNGDDQQVTVSGDSMCIELTGAQTLVVTLDIPQALDGFTTFSGDSTGATTYIASASCGIADFITLDSIGFPSNKWWVELSGDIGCEDGIIGDLNGDGVVNGADLAILASAWGTADPVADLNGDGIVNGADLSIQLSNWTN